MMAGSVATSAPPWPRWYRPPGYKRALQIRAIREAVQDHYSISDDDMLGTIRSRIVSHPRQLAMYIAWRHTACTYPQIGRAFNRDHSTVIHAVRAVKLRLSDDPRMAETYRLVRKRLAL